MQKSKPNRNNDSKPDYVKPYDQIYAINMALTILSIITVVGIPIYFLFGISYIIYAHTTKNKELIRVLWINVLITLVAIPLIGFSLCYAMIN